MRLAELTDTSRRVSETRGRLEKVETLAACLRRASPQELPVAVAYLSGTLPQGRIGVGPALIREAAAGSAAPASRLDLDEVDACIGELARTRGPGSAARRRDLLGGLFARAGEAEQRFLARLLLGELRQGALEGVMVEAVARACEVPAADVRRVLMLEGDLGRVARVAREGGREALGRARLQLFRPLQPMLASPADSVADALEKLGEAGLEWKLDGARVQVHKAGDDVRVFTRRLNDVTPAVPELVEGVRSLPAETIILDGEALALRADGRPQPFQVTMRRFGRRQDVDAMRDALPLTAFYFDCLRLDGDTLMDRSGTERAAALASALPAALRIPRVVTADADVAASFVRSALEAGHEGVMAKSLCAAYAAGSRGSDWLKLKPAHTLDLVVLAADWGHGRRRGRLSNLHLGARDPRSGQYVMLGKTFKGMTDAVLEWQTEKLLELETGRDGITVTVRPELVVEVAVGGVQASPQYPAGLALRFARLKRYRPDKSPEQADSLDTVRAIHEGAA
jgi:DNA ligase-1